MKQVRAMRIFAFCPFSVRTLRSVQDCAKIAVKSWTRYKGPNNVLMLFEIKKLAFDQDEDTRAYLIVSIDNNFVAKICK